MEEEPESIEEEDYIMKYQPGEMEWASIEGKKKQSLHKVVNKTYGCR